MEAWTKSDRHTSVIDAVADAAVAVVRALGGQGCRHVLPMLLPTLLQLAENGVESSAAVCAIGTVAVIVDVAVGAAAQHAQEIGRVCVGILRGTPHAGVKRNCCFRMGVTGVAVADAGGGGSFGSAAIPVLLPLMQDKDGLVRTMLLQPWGCMCTCGGAAIEEARRCCCTGMPGLPCRHDMQENVAICLWLSRFLQSNSTSSLVNEVVELLQRS